MDAADEQLRSALAAELLDRIMEQDPAFFERLVMGRPVQYGGLRSTFMTGTPPKPLVEST